ncbi:MULTISPECIES: hypothetical protein [Conchiformibius]|uniref:Uncharacterized protein n=3 Tax=Conchiformibius TaxID=334107 RepID=A0A3P2A4Z9_9NEIS|nr:MULTISPECIES: hypothetical protein [Conchiformibius]QMT34109.1 hypothetical protein H3L98_03660 [Conchiformibius steedae]RRD89300.1 hypothetical protein EII21_09375 [Conchiformibius steedae]UOP04504.1 hypothetical protein LVJ77_09510 [Conchiformibius kuhniae]URD66882.1 hypothetical protein LNQ82_06580 [Conchiformibius steedae DSM 2580]
MDLESAKSQFVRLWEIQNQLLLNDIDSEIRHAVSCGKRECQVYVGDVTTSMHDVLAYYERKGFKCELKADQKIMTIRGWALS